MASIIVPTDFSDNAYNALFYATRLFNDEVCKITLINSFEDQFSTSTSRIDIGRNEQLYDELEKRTMTQLTEVQHKIVLDSKDINLKIETACGAQPLHKMINKLLENSDAEFVVMGTKGASGLKEVFIGSQAVKVIKKIKPVPLFLIPQYSDAQEPNKIAYATDFKIDYSQYSFEIIKRIMRAHKSKLRVAHIYNQLSPENTVEANYRKLKSKLEDVEYTTHWISSQTSMEEALTNFNKEHQINLLVMMYHKYGFLKGLLKTSFVEKVSFHSKIPLLVLPDSF